MDATIRPAGHCLGLDLGTQSAKAVLCEVSGDDDSHFCKVVAIGHSRKIPMLDCRTKDQAEQHPESWIVALKEACSDVLRAYVEKHNTPFDVNSIRGVAVSGHQHGLVVLDEDDVVIRPCMMWCDTRAVSEAEEFSKLANFVCPPGFTAPKLMWMKAHEPKNFARISKVMLPHDYINYILSGCCVYAMERGDCSGTGLYSCQSNSLDKRLLDFIDPSLINKLPSRMVDPHKPIGSVDIEVFREFFPNIDGTESVALAPGCGDNAMSTLAVLTGSKTSGKSTPLILSLGTSGTITTKSSAPVSDPAGEIASFCDSTGRYLPLVCVQNCTLVLEEIRKSFAPEMSIGDITALAEKEPAGCEGIVMLPYFSEGGERTPNWPDSSGCFIGLKHGHLQRPGLLYRAAMESVTYALLRGYKRLLSFGVEASHILIVGGGAKNLFWRQMISDIFQTAVEVHDSDEVTANAAAVGAALQAAAIVVNASVGEVSFAEGEISSIFYKPVEDSDAEKAIRHAFNRHVALSSCLFGAGHT